MIKNVNSITIVGGGTAAWFTAAYYSEIMPNVSISLVDKEHGAPVGVGEGTLLFFDKFLQRCGFETKDWFNEVDAVFKAGILFPRFGGKDNLVWHPFYLDTEYANQHGVPSSMYEAWTHHQDTYPFNELSARFNESLHNNVDTSNIQTYAMHIDAAKLVLWLQKQLASKINIIKSEVTDITRDKNNNVTTLKCINGTELTSDFYIDCTGFNQLLQNDPDRVDLSDRLFVNTAVAGHVPYIDKDAECTPYVTSDAVDHGWIWSIPVQSRIGSGLVFNRDITDIDTAKDYFCKYWNNRIKPGDLKVINWAPYYNKNMWSNNVVAIGLSAGFIEPLESTGLATITKQIYESAQVIQTGYYTKYDIALYNQIQTAIFEDTADYVSMHYAYTDYNTDFWKYVKNNYTHSDRYKFYVDAVKQGKPLPRNGRGWFFGGTNWLCWIFQIETDIKPTQHINSNQALQIIDKWISTSQNNPCITHLDAVKDFEFLLNNRLDDASDQSIF